MVDGLRRVEESSIYIRQELWPTKGPACQPTEQRALPSAAVAAVPLPPPPPPPPAAAARPTSPPEFFVDRLQVSQLNFE